jgi:hypothetical protein
MLKTSRDIYLDIWTAYVMVSSKEAEGAWCSLSASTVLTSFSSVAIPTLFPPKRGLNFGPSYLK